MTEIAGYTMGIGKLGDNDTKFKRKFRWTLTLGSGGTADADEIWYAKTTKRPTLTIEESEINRLHEKHWISGKPVWEEMPLTVYDVAPSAPAAQKLVKWVTQVFEFGTSLSGYSIMDMGDPEGQYKQDLTIKMLDGHGNSLETWTIYNAWPKSSNWGDLDYSSSDPVDLELSLRFDRARIDFDQ